MNELSKPFSIPSHKTEDLVNELGKMPFGSLIGNILSSCVEAQSHAADTAWNYTQKVLEQQEPIVFTFQDNEGMKSLSVPLFTIVPLPYLKLDNIDIDFDAEASIDNSKSNEFLITVNNDTTEGDTNNVVKGKANLHIGINAGTSDMPAGLSMLLEYMGGGLVVEGPIDPDAERRQREEEERRQREEEERRQREMEERMREEEERRRREEEEEERRRQEEQERIRREEEERMRREEEERMRFEEEERRRREQEEEEERRRREEEERLMREEEERRREEERIQQEQQRKKAEEARTYFRPDFFKDIDDTTKWQGAGILGIHTIWSRPSMEKNGRFEMSDLEVLSTVYSALSWRKYNGAIRLYSDNNSFQYLRKLEMNNLWNNGIDTSVLNSIPSNIDSQIYYNAGKIFALKNLIGNRKFVMLETDTYLADSLNPIIQQNSKQPVIATMRMATTHTYYAPYSQLKIAASYKPQSPWQASDFDTCNPYLTNAIYYDTGDRDCMNFVQDYILEAIHFMQYNKQKLADPDALMRVVDDRFIGVFSKKWCGVIPIFGWNVLKNNDIKKYSKDATLAARYCREIGNTIIKEFPHVRLSDPVEKILLKYCRR